MNSEHIPVKILIVDDRPENLIALQAIFQRKKYIIIEANSGKEAFEQAKIHEFACILMDVQMPILDGFETARTIRRLPDCETTPIIFVTAIHRTEEYEMMGYISGAVDFIFKPINADILLAKVAVFVDLYQKTIELQNQKKILEEALEKSKENEVLKEALRARDEFLSMVSHELKTPITPLTLQMQTFIRLFETDSYKDVDKERLMRMLHTSDSQINRLGRLIHDLVDVSKLRSSKLDLNLEKTSLNEIIKKVITDFESEIKKTASVITLEEESEVIGNWDSFRLEQVIINLLTNALKYGLGKPIRIKIFKEETAVIEVIDEGIGIKTEDQLRIFDRFERAVSSTNYGGLGLGLYISREIINLHHGKIFVKESPVSGSTLRIELPL